MPITENPTIDLTERDVVVLYMTGGCAIFGCVDDPNGVIFANNPSLALSTNGNVYFKTTNNAATGWSLVGGGGGTGTVTNVDMTVPSSLLSVSGNPITTTGTLAVALQTQSANRIFAGPSTGAAAAPTFRALVAADLSLAAAPPANGLQYNDSTNAFTASNGFKVDPATNTLQVGELNVLKGTLQLQAGSGGGSYKITTSVPSTNHVWLLPDAAPTVDQLLKITNVSGANYTLGYISPSGLGFPSINATDGVLPYRSSSSAFSDSPLTRTSSSIVTMAGQYSFTNTGTGAFGELAGRGITLGTTGTLRFNFNFSNTWEFGSAQNVYATGGANFGVSTGHYGMGSLVQAPDVSITRLASGVARVANGSTGAGQLAVGSSAASSANQFLVDSQSTTRIAGFFSMPNGSSVPTIQGVTNSIQSFAFNPSGKIQGGMNIPTTNQQTAMVGNAKSDVSTIGNVGTGVDNLLSFVIQANVLNNTGDYAEFDAFGEFENNANNKNLSIVFGSTTIFTTGALPFGTAALANWRINAKILRTAASGQKCIVTFQSNDGTTHFKQTITTSGEDLTANKTVQFTGEATSNDDITQLHLESKLVIAQTS